MSFKHLAVGAFVCASLAAIAPAGYAQTPAQSGYGTPAGSVEQELGQNEPREVRRATARAPSDESSALPFTGLDLGLVAGVGGALLAFGFAVRRVVGSTTP